MLTEVLRFAPPPLRVKIFRAFLVRLVVTVSTLGV